MSEDELERSPELDQVRQLLFPDLAPEDGWSRIEAAFAAAANPERIDVIERLASADLSGDLMATVRRLREDADV